jgi:hypothetical protein
MSIPKPSEGLRTHASSVTNDRWLQRAGPLDALELIHPFAAALDAYEDDLVREACKQGHSWSEIADALGITRQAADWEFRHRAPTRRPQAHRPTAA